MYYMSEEGSRVYTLAKTDPNGDPTFSAHPARYGITYTVLPFSPPKGDLPPMGGILVKMPPQCPP